MDPIWNRIEEVAQGNNGFVRTAQVEQLGISRPMLKKYSDAGKLERIRKGLYVLAGELADEYALLQVRSKFALPNKSDCCDRTAFVKPLFFAGSLPAP